MKSSLTFALCVAGLCLILSASSLRADDWKTTDGKVYQNVSVVKAEPDAVTILHQNGGALVPLATLPPDLQKKFNYDPIKAKAAADARTQANAENGKALQAEMNQAERQRHAALVAEDPRSPALVSDPSASLPANISSFDDSLTGGPTGPTHHSMSDLVDLNLRLRDDHPDPEHHSMSSLLTSARSLGPDYSDPTHHTMGQLFGTDPLK